MKSTNEHWDTIFANTKECTLGWYEKDASQTMGLLDSIPNLKNSSFFLAGAGTTVLVDELLLLSENMIINDISSKAIKELQNRMNTEPKNIHWLCQDIALAIDERLPAVDIWIDRAVLHFLTQTDQKQTYLKNLKKMLKVGGYVLLAEFSKTGANQCAGLPVCQYDISDFDTLLGNDFSLKTSFEHLYINPNGDDRPYIYALYQRVQ